MQNGFTLFQYGANPDDPTMASYYTNLQSACNICINEISIATAKIPTDDPLKQNLIDIMQVIAVDCEAILTIIPNNQKVI